MPSNILLILLLAVVVEHTLAAVVGNILVPVEDNHLVGIRLRILLVVDTLPVDIRLHTLVDDDLQNPRTLGLGRLVCKLVVVGAHIRHQKSDLLGSSSGAHP